ncbi:MAG: TonB-dependent receptor plug domain-containing protein, partial [Fibrobacter sp.]|nr:TonB-dependent receptor plug domain-containing protein [Fibrobacter sp.]
MRSTRKMLRNGGGVIHTFFALWMAWALVPFAYAQEIQELGTTEIVAEPVTLADVAPSYQEILPSSWEGRGMSAAEVLSALPGIQSYKQGGMGSFQTVSVRGIAARNILICIDGVPMNDAGGGATSLASIDLNNVEKIEIYKDRVPAKFGGAGLGGAINFVTKSAIHRGGRILASVGNHNTFEGSAQVSLAVNDSIQFSATASMRHSDNDYEFENRAGTEYNEEDDFIDKRNNAQFTQYSGNVQYRILHDNGYFSTVSASMEHSEAGNPGREDSQTKVAKFTGDGSQV